MIRITREISRARKCICASAARGVQPKRLVTTGTEYCRDLVRKHDYDAYLTSMFHQNVKVMAAQWCFRAFNIETSMIKDSVSNDQIARMRLAWWRDAISSTFDGHPPDHPVLIELAKVLDFTDLTKTWFQKVIRAREANLSTNQFLTSDLMEAYAEDTQSSLLYLSLESIGIRDIRFEHVASHIGKSAGIFLLLRSTPYVASSSGHFVLPADVAALNGVTAEACARYMRSTFRPASGVGNSGDLLDGSGLEGVGEALRNIVHSCATTSFRHAETAVDHVRKQIVDCDDDNVKLDPAMIKRAFPVFMSVVPVKRYLGQLERSDFDLLRTLRLVKSTQWRLPFSLAAAYMRKRL